MKTVLIVGVIFLILIIGFYGIRWIKVFTASDYDQMLNALYQKTVPLINTIELKKLDNYIILDTRAANEYNVSSIPQSIWIDYPNTNFEQLQGYSKDQPIVVYCSVGYRSERVGEQLLEMGFTNVYNLYGGIFEWVNTNHQVVNSKQEIVNAVHGYSPSWGKWIENDIEVVYK